MKIGSTPGNHGFRALYNYMGMWEISAGVFFTYKEAEDYFTQKVPVATAFLWPIEEQEGGIIYVPAKEELEENNG